ncbi:MAG: Sir2 silent information regulator family NAD-dependent deacetylase [Prevotella sp.]|nr:Sir2 silent information regulator family NAD-dependent deacetylase [Prevotella sp.]
MKSFLDKVTELHRLIADADQVLIGAGAGLSAAAGLDYAGEDFRREFREWTGRYGITDLYSSSFYPFKTEEERWAYWAKHIWFARYRPEATPLYRQLYQLVKEKDYFVITTNVDGQFEKAGFKADRLFATQGDYAYFQPESGSPKVLYHNEEWVERALPAIKDCRIPTELIPHTPDGKPIAMNLRCDDTFVEDEHWHKQAQHYQQFVEKAYNKRLLLLEFGVGFNTPVIIRFPFERIAAQFPQATLVRFNRDYPQLTTEGVSRFLSFTEDLPEIINDLQTKPNPSSPHRRSADWPSR